MTSAESTNGHIEKSLKAATILRKIFHAQSCRGECGDSKCFQTSHSLSHMETGCTSQDCSFPGCNTIRKLLGHYKNCCRNNYVARITGQKINHCLICSLAAPSITPSTVLESEHPRKHCKRDVSHEGSPIRRSSSEPMSLNDKNNIVRDRSFSDISASPNSVTSALTNSTTKRPRLLSDIGVTRVGELDGIQKSTNLTFINRDPSFSTYRVSWESSD